MKKPKKINIDTSLTPESAESKGYIWWQDHIYDPELEINLYYPEDDEFIYDDLRKDIEQGWRVGQAANPRFHENAIGMYKPLKKSDQ